MFEQINSIHLFVGRSDKEDDVEADGLDVDEVDDVVPGANVIDSTSFDVSVVSSLASVSIPSARPHICGRPSNACISASSDAVKEGGAGPPPVLGLLSILIFSLPA